MKKTIIFLTWKYWILENFVFTFLSQKYFTCTCIIKSCYKTQRITKQKYVFLCNIKHWRIVHPRPLSTCIYTVWLVWLPAAWNLKRKDKVGCWPTVHYSSYCPFLKFAQSICKLLPRIHVGRFSVSESPVSWECQYFCTMVTFSVE